MAKRRTFMKKKYDIKTHIEKYKVLHLHIVYIYNIKIIENKKSYENSEFNVLYTYIF